MSVGSSSPPSSPRSYLIPGLALLVVVLALAVGGVALDRHLRPPVGIDQGSLVSAAASPRTSSNALPTANAATSVSGVAAPTDVPLPSGAHIANSPLEQEIMSGYLHYWDIRAQAYLSLDVSHLGEVMNGAELTRAQKQIADLKAQGRAGKLDVDHHVLFVSESSDQAVLYDEYLNRSVFLDAATMQPLPTSGPPSTARVSYDLQKLDGVWKVVDGNLHD